MTQAQVVPVQSTRQLWKGIGSAKIFERGNYVKGGFSGIVRIKRTLAKQTRGSGLAFIVEMEVVESNMEQVHPVGSKVTWYQGMKDLDIAFPAIKVWAAACVGYGIHQKDKIEELSEILEDLMTHATDNEESNDFIGVLLKLETVVVKTKKNQDFTRYDFGPTDQQRAA